MPKMRNAQPKISTFSHNKHISDNKHIFFGLTKMCILGVETVCHVLLVAIFHDLYIGEKSYCKYQCQNFSDVNLNNKVKP